jgi:hypothetical protein
MVYLKIFLFLLIVFTLKISAQKDYSIPVESDEKFTKSTLAEQGLDEKMILAAVDSINNGVYSNIHSLLILKNNKLVLEKYFEGEDAIIGKGWVGLRQHDIDSRHYLNCFSKRSN